MPATSTKISSRTRVKATAPALEQSGVKKFRSAHAELKLDDARGTVEAYVSVYGNLDSYGEIVDYGAFAKSLGRKLPVIAWAHDWSSIVGKTLEAEEVPAGDPRLPAKIRQYGGLRVLGQMFLDTIAGREAYLTVKNLADRAEFSIGYTEVETAQQKDGRHLLELDLMEWSPVLAGANDLTTPVAIKAQKLDGDLHAHSHDHQHGDGPQAYAHDHSHIHDHAHPAEEMPDEPQGDDGDHVHAHDHAHLMAETHTHGHVHGHDHDHKMAGPTGEMKAAEPAWLTALKANAICGREKCEHALGGHATESNLQAACAEKDCVCPSFTWSVLPAPASKMPTKAEQRAARALVDVMRKYAPDLEGDINEQYLCHVLDVFYEAACEVLYGDYDEDGDGPTPGTTPDPEEQRAALAALAQQLKDLIAADSASDLPTGDGDPIPDPVRPQPTVYTAREANGQKQGRADKHRLQAIHDQVHQLADSAGHDLHGDGSESRDSDGDETDDSGTPAKGATEAAARAARAAVVVEELSPESERRLAKTVERVENLAAVAAAGLRRLGILTEDDKE